METKQEGLQRRGVDPRAMTRAPRTGRNRARLRAREATLLGLGATTLPPPPRSDSLRAANGQDRSPILCAMFHQLPTHRMSHYG